MSVMLDARNPGYPFTMAAAVAVREALITLSGIETHIKWVNDLFYNHKKVCGILTETKTDGNYTPKGFVCGIGINTSGTVIPEALSEIAGTIPYSLNNSTLSEFIAKKLIFFYENNINPLEKYREGLILNVPVKAFSNKELLFEGIAKDINEHGNLIILTDNGEEKTLNSGEISIRF